MSTTNDNTTSAYNITQIDGDVSVGRNVAMGGRATVAGNVKIGHNLKVEGWLEAPNIKDTNKGLFATSTALASSYPSPKVGWWALVGDSSPFAVYRCNTAGTWSDTSGTVTVTPEISIENGIAGWVAISNTSELPADPTPEEQSKGYLLGTVLYIYVGEGGDTLDGKYQSAQLKGETGAQGEKGEDGVDLGEVAIADNVTTDDATKVLSAKQGKVLNDKVTITEENSWGDTTGSSSAYGQYMWPFFKPIDKPCKVTKMYVNDDYASTLESDTSIKLFVAELNETNTVYSITSLITATLLAGESSVDLNINLPANSSLYIEFVYPASQQSFCLARPDLSDDDAYPQELVQKGYVSVGTDINVSGTSKSAWGLKFDYVVSKDIKSVINNHEERIAKLEEGPTDEAVVSYENPTILLAMGSSLTDTHEAYKGGAWLDILNDMVDVVVVNGGVSGNSRPDNFKRLLKTSLLRSDATRTIGTLFPTYICSFNTANMIGDNAIGEGAQPDLEYGLSIVRMEGAELMLATELPMYHLGKEFDQTYTAFARKHNLLVSPYCEIAGKLAVGTPYPGFNDGVHHGYRGKSYALAHYDLLSKLPIKKSIKFFAVRPDYQGGSPTYDQLIYDNNEERFVKFHAVKGGEGSYKGTKAVDNLDSSDYYTSTGTNNGEDGLLGQTSSFTSMLQRGATVSFENFALCEVILDKTNCTKGSFKCMCSAEPSAVYLATMKSSFDTPMSEWTLLEHDYYTENYNNWLSVSFERSNSDFMVHDKVRILICYNGTFTLAKPTYYGYDGREKPDIEPLRDYHIRQYGAELLAKTSCEDGWTMGGNASVQSLPTEIANYSGYNNVKSHIELASDSDYCTKSVAITQPCSKVAIRVVANLFPKIATSRTFSQMTDAQKAKYISTAPTIAEYGYNFGTLRVSLGNGTVKDFTMWPGWFEYYIEADVAPNDTSLTLTVKRALTKSGVTTNSDFNVFIHDVSVQKIV